MITLSTITGSEIPNLPIQAIPEVQVETVQNDVLKQKQTIEKATTTEAYVRNYFSDTPILIEIARCESEFRQLNKNGNVLRGIKNSYDVGVMQINEKWHAKRAKELGYNIYSLTGNMAYGRRLYEEQGTKPWLASSACWSKHVDSQLAKN